MGMPFLVRFSGREARSSQHPLGRWWSRNRDYSSRIILRQSDEPRIDVKIGEALKTLQSPQRLSRSRPRMRPVSACQE